MYIIQCILLVILYIPNVMFRGPQYLLELKVKCMSRMQTITLNLTAQVKDDNVAWKVRTELGTILSEYLSF
jgi:hypothetical protein